MKKRLLITSIVMMLVVAVALSTATYAWFTSNATVSASQVTMTAAVNGEAALGISWTDGNYNPSISPVISSEAGYVFSPCAPLTLSKSGTITDSTVDFYTASTKQNNGVFKFNSAGTLAVNDTDNNIYTYHTYTWADTGAAHTSFFVKNLSNTNALSGDLTLTATITGAGAELMRVGVFKYNATSEKYELIEVLANKVNAFTVVTTDATLAADTAYYKIVLGQYVLATPGTAPEVADGTADYVPGTTTAPADTYYTMNTTVVTAGTTLAEDTEYYKYDSDDGYVLAVAGDATAVQAGTADYVAGTTTAPADTYYTVEKTHAKAVYGEITNGKVVNTMSTYTCAESVNVVTGLAANTAVELKIIVWMDGAALGDAQQDRAATIALDFDVQPTPQQP